MCFAIDCQMQLSPDTTALMAVLFDFPLAFTKTFSPVESITRCAISPRVGVLKLTLTELCPLADTAVIRAAQRNVHQGKNGINKTLRRPQGEPEHAFNHQDSGNGKVRIALRSSSDEGVADSYQA
jgi:hypothetical protein